MGLGSTEQPSAANPFTIHGGERTCVRVIRTQNGHSHRPRCRIAYRLRIRMRIHIGSVRNHFYVSLYNLPHIFVKKYKVSHLDPDVFCVQETLTSASSPWQQSAESASFASQATTSIRHLHKLEKLVTSKLIQTYVRIRISVRLFFYIYYACRPPVKRLPRIAHLEHSWTFNWLWVRIENKWLT
jgi:hypothetical protein